MLDKKVSMEEFVAQISEEDLIAMFRGEGMCSRRLLRERRLLLAE